MKEEQINHNFKQNCNLEEKYKILADNTTYEITLKLDKSLITINAQSKLSKKCYKGSYEVAEINKKLEQNYPIIVIFNMVKSELFENNVIIKSCSKKIQIIFVFKLEEVTN